MSPGSQARAYGLKAAATASSTAPATRPAHRRQQRHEEQQARRGVVGAIRGGHHEGRGHGVDGQAQRPTAQGQQAEHHERGRRAPSSRAGPGWGGTTAGPRVRRRRARPAGPTPRSHGHRGCHRRASPGWRPRWSPARRRSRSLAPRGGRCPTASRTMMAAQPIRQRSDAASVAVTTMSDSTVTRGGVPAWSSPTRATKSASQTASSVARVGRWLPTASRPVRVSRARHAGLSPVSRPESRTTRPRRSAASESRRRSASSRSAMALASEAIWCARP